MATVIGRGLGAELRELRRSRKLTGKQVSETLGWPASKLSRMETGKQGIKVADVASLLVVYGVTGAERDRLLKLAERSDEAGWWEVLSGLSDESKTLIRLETSATAIAEFEPLLVPGLLQVPDYTRAVMRACGLSEEHVETRLSARMGRQALLSREKPPEMRFIVDEMALRRVVGSPAAAVKQLRHIAEMLERSNVVLRVLPFSVGAHTGLDGNFTIFDFTRAQSVVYVDNKLSGGFLEEPEQIELFRREADRLEKAALSPGESADLVAAIAREHDRA